MKSTFARHAIPEILASDNGLQFSADINNLLKTLIFNAKQAVPIFHKAMEKWNEQ